jgi:hypothetical protein
VARHQPLAFRSDTGRGVATLHAYIVTPTTTDRLCAPYLTRGEVSCQNGNRVRLNAKRWLLGADSYGSDLTNYRRYLINHEFGNALGKHHLDCPGPGRLAPVMMQQTKRARRLSKERLAAAQPRLRSCYSCGIEAASQKVPHDEDEINPRRAIDAR